MLCLKENLFNNISYTNKIQFIPDKSTFDIILSGLPEKLHIIDPQPDIATRTPRFEPDFCKVVVDFDIRYFHWIIACAVFDGFRDACTVLFMVLQPESSPWISLRLNPATEGVFARLQFG